MPPHDEGLDIAAPDRVDRRLIDRLHGELPLVERPFAVVGGELGISEDEVIERLRRLLAHGTLTVSARCSRSNAPAGCSCSPHSRCPRPISSASLRSSMRCPRWRTTTAANTG
jgi:hypothetical protein